MPIYFTGLTSSTLFKYRRRNASLQSTRMLKEIICPLLTDIEIGNTYLLLWRAEKLFISCNRDRLFGRKIMGVRLPNPTTNGYCKLVVPHHERERFSILSTNNVFWEYDINGNIWEKRNVFRPDCQFEHAVKIIHCGYNMLLTNLGHFLIMHDQLEITKHNVKFIDIAHGAEYVILLGNDSNVYVLTVRMLRLENCNKVPEYYIGPVLIPELSEQRIVQIAAGASHCAAITEEGHLYTWGSNRNGELGLNDYRSYASVPQLVSFQRYHSNEEVKVKKVACGSHFTVCLADDGTLWGAGDNSSWQLGRLLGIYTSYPKFMKLHIEPLDGKTVKDLKCNEKGTAIITE